MKKLKEDRLVSTPNSSFKARRGAFFEALKTEGDVTFFSGREDTNALAIGVEIHDEIHCFTLSEASALLRFFRFAAKRDAIWAPWVTAMDRIIQATKDLAESGELPPVSRMPRGMQ